MHKHIAVFLMTASIAACTTETQTNNNPYYTWEYVCGKGQGMTWTFQEEQRGVFNLDGGSILRPANPDNPTDRVFKRQDGELFTITGSGDAWDIKRVTTGKGTKCKRVREDYDSSTKKMDVLVEPIIVE